MAKVRVFNESNVDYVEEYKGDVIVVPGKGYIEMARRDAVNFLGTYSGASPTDSTVPKEKRLKIVENNNEHEKTTEYVCNFDGKKFSTQKELDEYLESISDLTADKDSEGAVKPRKYNRG